RPPPPTLFPYTTLFRSCLVNPVKVDQAIKIVDGPLAGNSPAENPVAHPHRGVSKLLVAVVRPPIEGDPLLGKFDWRPYHSDQKRSEEHTSELQSRFDLV